MKSGLWQSGDGMCAQSVRAWVCNLFLRAGRWKEDVREDWRHGSEILALGLRDKKMEVEGVACKKKESIKRVRVTVWYPNSEEKDISVTEQA